MRTRIAAASVIALTLALSACATGAPMSEQSTSEPSTPQPEASSSRPPFQTTTPGAIAPTGTPATVPPSRWAAIESDLAERGVTGTPVLLSSEDVVFNDGSLGCARPGQSYTQALVDGMRVVVEVDGKTYDYRFGEGDAATLCAR